MTKISLIAKLPAAEGKIEELKAALAVLIEAGAEETGLEIYSAHQDNENPNVFWFFELYADDDAVAVHGKGDAMRAAMGAVGKCLAGALEVTRMTPVVAKGLDI